MNATLPSFSLLLFCLLASPATTAQNLLANGDFEQVNSCHQYKEPCSPKAWRSCGSKLFGFHKTTAYQRHISLLLFNQAKAEERKYAQTELLCPLEEGKAYELRLQVKTDLFRLGHIGALFVDKHLFSKKRIDKDSGSTHLELTIPESLREETWTELSVTFTAQGNERVLILGNFLPDAQTQITPINARQYKKYLKSYRPRKRVQYAIDQVSLRPLDVTVNCDDLAAAIRRVSLDSVRHSFTQITPPPPATPAPAAQPMDSSLAMRPPSSPPLSDKIILQNLEFDSNQAKLRDSSCEELDKVLGWMQRNPNLKAVITGFTDDIGSSRDNMELSMRRAEAVANYLVNKGIARFRLRPRGQGENLPLARNDNETGRQQNRRVEIIFSR
ncbi:MAG: OmpA family protein [Bacteroidota bacterium]